MNLSRFPSAPLLIVSMSAGLIGAMISNLYCKRMVHSARDRYLCCTVTNLVCAVLLWASAGFQLKVSGYTVLLAALFGVVTLIGSLFSLAALTIGPFSYTSVIASFSVVITSLSGFFFWNEELGLQKIIGIVLMLVCLIISVKKEESKKSVTLKWFILALMAAVSTAGVGMLQKVHQNSPYKDELMLFLIIAFAVGFVLSLILYITSREAKPAVETTKYPMYMILILLAVSGICTAMNNVLNLHLSGAMDSAVFFPIVSGGGLILNILSCLVFFHEKLSVRQWFGIACGVAATLLLCL